MSDDSWSMKIILQWEGCLSSWNIQQVHFSWRVKIKYFTMINILPIEGWFSYFTNYRTHVQWFNSWSMKIILHQEGCVSLQNVWFSHVTKNRRVGYFTMINILPIKGWFSYSTNKRTHASSFHAWSMRIILQQEGCLSSLNVSKFTTMLWFHYDKHSSWWSMNLILHESKDACLMLWFVK